MVMMFNSRVRERTTDPHPLTVTGVILLAHAPRARLVLSVVATALLAAACGSTTVTPAATPSPSSTLGLAASPSAMTPSPSSQPASPTASPDATGFAFAAEDIAAYYETQAYTCSDPQPSTRAAGFTVRSCELTDADGRTRVIGLVTDPDGGLADAFASVTGTETETILAPIDALDPLSGFLGATLGEDTGAALLTWLAGHLGDTYAETTSGAIKVATYTESEEDHSRLYVEVANQTYLDAAPVEAP